MANSPAPARGVHAVYRLSLVQAFCVTYRLPSGLIPPPVGKSSIAATLSVHCRNEIIAEIALRADALSMQGRGSYAAKVLEWWYAQGCPAVTPADQAMQDIRALERAKAAEGKRRAS